VISKIKLIYWGYFLVIIGLFLYSFTQVDLSLTLSQLSVWQDIQKFFQHIGYFQRPLSTFFYVVIVSLLFLFYFFIIRLAKIGGIRDVRGIWILTIATATIMTFSYNAFSYDLFNYIFDTKIVTFYNQNPYLYKALDFPGDQMLSFMHSTHRPYPYGPNWLILTVPLSFIGFQFFLPTFFLFKSLMSLSFIGTAFFIGKILKKISPQNELFGVVFFALNPLIIIEGLVSAHNDIVMVFFAIFGLYLLLKKNYVFSFLLLFLSIGIKFATIFLLPVFIYIAVKQFRNQSIDFKKVFAAIFVLMAIAVLVTSFSSGVNKNPELQPWYFLMIIPFAAFMAQKKLVFLLTIFASIAMLASYIPFLLMGEWPNDIVDLKNKLLLGFVSLGLVIFFLNRFRTKIISFFPRFPV
jgi:hypothetical protein